MVFWRRRAKRNPRASFHDAESSVRAARWLGVLAAECARRGIPIPPLVTVDLDDSTIRLRLATPRPDAPLPWMTSPDATTWTRRIDGQGHAPAAQATGFSRGLTAVGLRGQRTMLVDLTESGSLIRLSGEWQDRLEVARRWVDERSRAPWSRGFPVVLVELPELATEVTLPYSTRQLANVVAMGGDGIAFLREAPAPHEHSALLDSLRAPGCRWAVVVLDEVPARWTFDARPDGRVRSDVFPTRAAVPALVPGPVPVPAGGSR